MSEHYSPPAESEDQSALSPEGRDRFRVRALDALIEKLQGVENTAPTPEQQTPFIEPLFRVPAIAALLEELDIHHESGENITFLIQKMEAARAALLNKKNQFIPEQETPRIEGVKPLFANEADYQTAGEILDTVNELVKANHETEEELEAMKSALARLAIFTVDIDPKEKVEIKTSDAGSVDILFESDVREAERLLQVKLDVEMTQKRIAEYDRELTNAEGSEEKGGFLSIFKSKAPVAGPSPEAIEIMGKKARSEEALAGLEQSLMLEKGQVQSRIAQKKEALELLIETSGKTEFSGSWQKLLDILEERAAVTIESLEGSLVKRDEQIAALEARMSTLQGQPAEDAA